MAALGMVSILTLGSEVAAQDKPKGEEPAAKSRDAPPQEDWMKLTEPDENHKRLDVLVGKWNQTVRSPGAAEGEWTESKGTASYRWVLGGRFLMEEVSCDFAGTKFEWIGLYGYDKVRKKYTAVWADNFGTSTDFGEGDADKEGKVFTFSGEQVDPMSGKKGAFRWVITVESKDKVRVEMFEPGPDGKEAKAIEIMQARAK
jgi:hypothetical protein